VVRVVPDVPAIHRRFDYSVPAALGPTLRVGSRVRIELHGRRVGAWVVEDQVADSLGVPLKPLAASSGDGPPPELVALAEWAAWRWAGPMSSFLGTASPPRLVRGVWSREGTPTGPVDGGSDPRTPSPGGGSVELVDGVLETARPTDAGGVAEGPEASHGHPSVVRLAPSLDATLVVRELIHRLGPAGLLVLVPSAARAARLAGLLRSSGVEVALMPDGWERAAAGRSVVVGTRAAAWAPIPHLRAVVVLDAHDEVYREERSPTWSAVDVVVERGSRDGAPVALVSSCPPVAMAEGRRLVTTARAVERRGWPVVEVVDRTGDDPRTGLFSERLARLLHTVLDQPEGRMVCILNRTGRARLLACAHCGALARCTRCGGAMAQDRSGEGLQCRRCEERRPTVCAECDATRLKALRIGVTRATEELSALTGVEAREVTGSSDPADTAGLAVARLVVGTEAALHRVRRATAVAFLDIDQHLLAARFGAGEETLALLARAARLVGTRDGGGRLLVQTRIPDHEVLRAAVHADPALLSEPERLIRQTLGLPPFGALAVLRGPGGPAYADGLGSVAGISVSSDGDRWLVRAPDHATLCDGLASVPRPTERLRVEVDPADA
jgi:primosomal protein N' (replication factor Y)